MFLRPSLRARGWQDRVQTSGACPGIPLPSARMCTPDHSCRARKQAHVRGCPGPLPPQAWEKHLCQRVLGSRPWTARSIRSRRAKLVSKYFGRMEAISYEDDPPVEESCCTCLGGNESKAPEHWHPEARFPDNPHPPYLAWPPGKGVRALWSISKKHVFANIGSSDYVTEDRLRGERAVLWTWSSILPERERRPTSAGRTFKGTPMASPMCVEHMFGSLLNKRAQSGLVRKF